MINNILKINTELKNYDFRILSCIEINMRHREWVTIFEIKKCTKLSIENLIYRLSFFTTKKVVLKTLKPYEGYKLSFCGYDLLAFNTYYKRNTFHKIGSNIGVGKESIVFEVQKNS